MSDPALPRWAAMVAVRIAAAAGAIFGIVLAGRADALAPRLLGLALTLSALWVMAIVPRALARRWSSRG